MSYTGPILEDVAAEWLDEPCMAALGDGVEYAADGVNFYPLRAYVDYRDALRSIETGQVIEQDISVEILKSALDAKPTSVARLRLGRLPGKTFKPVNITSDTSGVHWACEVKLTNG